MPGASRSSPDLGSRSSFSISAKSRVSIVSSFGKRPNSNDFGVVLQLGKRPLSCRIIERTLRVVRLVVADPATVADQFKLVVDNGNMELFCKRLSAGEDCILARYSQAESAHSLMGLGDVAAYLEEAERWKG